MLCGVRVLWCVCVVCGFVCCVVVLPLRCTARQIKTWHTTLRVGACDARTECVCCVPTHQQTQRHNHNIDTTWTQPHHVATICDKQGQTQTRTDAHTQTYTQQCINAPFNTPTQILKSTNDRRDRKKTEDIDKAERNSNNTHGYKEHKYTEKTVAEQENGKQRDNMDQRAEEEILSTLCVHIRMFLFQTMCVCVYLCVLWVVCVLVHLPPLPSPPLTNLTVMKPIGPVPALKMEMRPTHAIHYISSPSSFSSLWPKISFTILARTCDWTGLFLSRFGVRVNSQDHGPSQVYMSMQLKSCQENNTHKLKAK